jgi:pyrroloquinoline quinone biosynthesis protein B
MGRLTAIVLGAAAGGGFPQWNCRCAVCQLAWNGDARVKPRTQASLAVSSDGCSWVVLNASPDLRAQLQATPALHPRGSPRGSPITAIVLTGAEIDQTAGLLHLRERGVFGLFATPETLEAVNTNPMFGVLADDVVKRQAVSPGQPFEPAADVEIVLFTVPGKVPLYLEGDNPELCTETAANVGAEIQSGGKRIVYVPSAAALTPDLMTRFASADVLFFDGTLYRDDEMIASKTGTKTGRRMGHMPIDGGSLAALARVGKRRIYIHINNTNPILVEGSPERRNVLQAGFEIAEDGMEIAL